MEKCFLLMDIWASPTGFREGIKEFLSLFEEKFAQTREKANELLETIGRRQS